MRDNFAPIRPLGVTLDVDGMFYLKQLVYCSQFPEGKIKENDIIDLYVQLSARFEDHGNSQMIRDAFCEHSLIYIPSSDRKAYPQFQHCWVSNKDVFWDGPRSILSKMILSSLNIYRPLEKLFVQQLRIPKPPGDILWEELSQITEKIGERALTADEHRIVFNILKDINELLHPRKKGANSYERDLSWLKELQDLPVFPAISESATGEIRLYDPTEVYNPLGGEYLVDVFRGRVPILTAPRNDSLKSLNALLQSEACYNMQILSTEVRKKIIASRPRQADIVSKERYLSRWKFVQRLALFELPGDKARCIAGLKDIAVYDVQELSCRYILDDIATKPEPQTLMLKLGQGLITVLRCTVNSNLENDQETDDFEFAKAIADEWELNFADIVLMLTSSETSLKLFFSMKQVPKLSILLRKYGSDVSNKLQSPPVKYKNKKSDVSAMEEQPNRPDTPPAGPETEVEIDDRPVVRSKRSAFTNTDKHGTSEAARARDLSSNAAYVTKRLTRPADSGSSAASSPTSTSSPESDSATSADSDIEMEYGLVSRHKKSREFRRSFSGGTRIEDDVLMEPQLQIKAQPPLEFDVEAFMQNHQSVLRQAVRKHDIACNVTYLHQQPLVPTIARLTNATPWSSIGHPEHSPQSAEKIMIGAVGELFVWKLLRSKRLPGFSVDNWTSQLRHYTTTFEFEQSVEASTADFVYRDQAGMLTKILFGENSIPMRKWSSAYPRYHLEVKSTSGGKDTPFHLSRRQLQIGGALTIRNWEKPPTDVYVLVRVWNVQMDDLGGIECEAYPDPHRLFYNCKLRIDSDSVSVSIQEG